MISNCTLLDDSVARRLNDIAVSFIQVTLDGPPHIHDQRRRFRTGSAFDATLRGIHNVLEHSDCYVHIRVNVDSRNLNRVEELLEQVQDRGCDLAKMSVEFGAVDVTESSCADNLPFCMSTEQFASIEVKMHQLAMRYGFKWTLYPIVAWGGCGATRPTFFTIAPDGSVHKCWNTIRLGEKAKRCGQIFDQSVRAPDANLHNWLAWDPFSGKACRDCILLPACFGGCPYKSLYPDSVAVRSAERCAQLKYNLEETLTAFFQAREEGSLSDRLSPGAYALHGYAERR